MTEFAEIIAGVKAEVERQMIDSFLHSKKPDCNNKDKKEIKIKHSTPKTPPCVPFYFGSIEMIQLHVDA